jgi:putative colanic acid biosynthesis acetyltransferase WcaF
VQNLNHFNNSWYKPGRNILIRSLWYFTNALFINSYLIPVSAIKRSILRLFGAKIGKSVVIKPKVNIKYPWRLKVGDYSWIGENVWIDNLDNVYIGENACISQGALLLCGNHDYKSENFDLITGPIHIGNKAWVGAKSIVAPGVKLGVGSILTAGSIASKDLDAGWIYRGNPAVKIRKRMVEKVEILKPIS